MRSVFLSEWKKHMIRDPPSPLRATSSTRTQWVIIVWEVNLSCSYGHVWFACLLMFGILISTMFVSPFSFVVRFESWSLGKKKLEQAYCVHLSISVHGASKLL
ncbi:hypothetical protein CEXT_443351 [Caerostris extrusa]|uniref:Uncharacterized protein n=1 Tax=Caerostris extrusa TaxID=172846 RepID=A0AAV4RN74_CAEEX|nr:hypothetical protein CEXT_443351 [Caerostris extrusa]